MVAWLLVIYAGELGAKAASEPLSAVSHTAQAGTTCIIPPQTIEDQAKTKGAEDAKLKAAFEGGQIADLNTLSVKQLQTLTKQNGVSIARTKSDFIHLLDAAEPGVDHSTLAGAALDAKLKEHKIGLLRTRDDLMQLLSQKQASPQAGAATRRTAQENSAERRTA